MKKILLLGGSMQQITAIKAAKNLGYYTILCDYLVDNPGQYAADRFYQISTTDKDAVYLVAKKENIDGVLAYASDPAAPTAAYVTEKMGLSGNPYDAVEILCNKDKFRFFLKNNGFDVPAAKGYRSVEKVVSDSESFVYPIVVKPVDSSGSKGVTVLYTAENLKNAVEFAFSFSRNGKIIVEEFVKKKHEHLIGGDVFVIDGKIVLWGLMNCHRDSDVNPLVPTGKSYPLILNSADRKKVQITLQSLVSKLGIKNGAMNVELIVDNHDKVFLIDAGPRSGGNMIPDLLNDMFNVDIAEMSVLGAMGENIKCKIKQPEGFYATHNIHSSKNGFYEGIEFDDIIKKYVYRKVLYKKVGDKVEYFDNATKCLGIVFMKFDQQEEMREVLKNIQNYIHVKLRRGGVNRYLVIFFLRNIYQNTNMNCHFDLEVAA